MSAAVEVRPALMGQLKELRLPTVRQCYEETARREERETLSYERYLLEVITRECEQRRKTRVERLLRESELPLEKSLPNFDVKRLPTKAQRQLKALLEGDFLNRKENVLVFGRPGSGKSHLLTALAQELIVARERRMHFTKCSLLMQDLLAAKRDLRLSREVKRLGRFEGLIIDKCEVVTNVELAHGRPGNRPPHRCHRHISWRLERLWRARDRAVFCSIRVRD